MNLTYNSELPAKNDLFAFYEKLGWNDFLQISPEQLLTAMKQSYYSLYVYCGNELIGTGRVVSDGIINAYACGLGVLPDYRRQGIGTEIVRKLKECCANNNLHMQFLCEEHLVPYYSKMGFEKFASGMR